MGMRLAMGMQQQLRINKRLQRFYDNLFLTSPELAFLPGDLKGKVSGEENIRVNKSFGKQASGFLESLIRHYSNVAEVRGKNILHWGWGLDYDAKYVRTAIEHGVYVEAYDISPLACLRAERYFAKLGKKMQTDYRPIAVHGDLNNFCHLNHMETVCINYLCRVLVLQEPRQQARILRDIGRCQFRQDDPGYLVIIQAFKDNNLNVQEHTSSLMYISEMMSFLNKGAKRNLKVHFQQEIRYYYKRCTAMAISI